MGRRIVFDIEANNLLQIWDQVDEIHCIVAKDIDTQEIFTFGDNKETQFSLKQFKALLGKCSVVIGHNIIRYDLPLLNLLMDVEFSIADTINPEELKDNPHWSIEDTVMGKPCHIVDTLVMSKTLNPDRYAHGLEWWGRQLGLLKGSYGKDTKDAWRKFSPEMLEYCINDVELNIAVYEALMQEKGSWDWDTAIWLESAIADIIFRQEQYGFLFDQKKAKIALEDLNEKLADIEARVEPRLPAMPLSKSEQPDFPKQAFNSDKSISATGWNWLRRLGYKPDQEVLDFTPPPATAFKKDMSLSVAGRRYCEKAGVFNEEEMPAFIEVCREKAKLQPLSDEEMVQAKKDLREKRMPPMTKPAQLSNQAFIKSHLVTLGWEPINFKDKDLTVGVDKRKKTREKFIESCERYIEETENSVLKPFRLDHLKVDSIAEMRQRFLEHDMKRPLKVITQPTYTEGNDKEKICPNLLRLGEKVDYVQDVVYWLTYRHRRNSILSPNGTGFLAHPRLQVDGRLPTPADTCGCSTSRFQHKIVANIPRSTSLYGEPLRELFCVEKGKVQIGCDADGLEARVEGHYCIPYNGKEYAKALVEPKPNDIHTVNAKKMNVPRDDAKVLKYSSSYGAQPPKIAKQMGWSLKKSKEVFNAFWKASQPLADLQQALEKHWIDNSKKWILGVDNRKLPTRAKHALLNTLFQSAGVICMKRAMVYWDRWIRDENLPARQLIAYHDESQMDDDASNVEIKVFSTEDEAEAWKHTQEEATGRVYSGIGHSGDKYWCGYSRAGELAVEAILKGGQFFNLRVDLTSGYDLGRNWAQCH